MNVYLLSFNAERFSGQPQMVDAFISNHRDIAGWSAPFAGCYLLKSPLSAQDLRIAIDDFFDKRAFILAKLTRGTANIDGRTTPEIWDWIKTADSENS